MARVSSNTVMSLQKQCEGLDELQIIKILSSLFPGKVSFSTSFGYEDQVVSDLIVKAGAEVNFFTLDTGRLFSETYSVWMRTREHYGISIKAFYPDKKQLQVFVTQHGPNAFYESIEKRKNCCYIRKVAPLKKALEGQSIWITGLRSKQSATRSELPLFEWDETHEVVKYNPLLLWSTEQVQKYIIDNHVPYNSLHDKGFPSIGCAPCTRPVKEGEDIRAGRWWWENNSGKECGLHEVHTKRQS